MSSVEFYSDRVNGPTQRSHEKLPKNTAQGLISLVERMVTSHQFASKYPNLCEDGQLFSTDVSALEIDIKAQIPGINKWPLLENLDLPDETVFDLVEFSANRVELPVLGGYHHFFKHKHIRSFDKGQACINFHQEVNKILERGGVRFELVSNVIKPIDTPLIRLIRKQIRELCPNSGDDELDKLVSLAFDRYGSRKEEDRSLALEKLWDAFERLKTLEGTDKKIGTKALLDKFESGFEHDHIENDMLDLTKIGNAFMIRHFETGKHPVSPQMREYLFTRMGNLILVLLQNSGRVGYRGDSVT